MLIDRNALRGPDASYDVVIVGAGPAGISVAQQLRGCRLDILLLEAGGTKETSLSRNDYEGLVSPGSGHPPLDLFRVCALGGTSRIWGGRTIPLDPLDFQNRDWVGGSGWPIPYSAVAAYYPGAFEACEAGGGESDPGRGLSGSQAELFEGLDGPTFQTTLERFSRPTNFWKRFGPGLIADKRVHVLPNAKVLEIELASNGMLVESLLVHVNGHRHKVSGRSIVLAGGGLEVPRLLLASNKARYSGVGNEYGHVGRHYMGHLCATMGTLRLNAGRSPACHYERDADGIYVRRRLWLTPAVQRHQRLLNTTFRVHIPEPADPAHQSGVLSAMYFTKFLVQREYASRFAESPVSVAACAKHFGNIVKNIGSLTRFSRKWIRERILADRKLPSVILGANHGRYAIEFHSEQSPNASSRVTLGSERDRHGMRRLVVDWQCHDRDIESLRRAYVLLGQELERTGTGSLDVDLSALTDKIRRFGISTGHHIGTTRMSADPRQGVVDEDCRVHGIANLFIAGSSVFPTSGQANPTLTTVALAFRLADRLQCLLTRSRASTLATRVPTSHSIAAKELSCI